MADKKSKKSINKELLFFMAIAGIELFYLATTEIKRTGKSLFKMACLLIMLSVFMLTAWFFLMGALIFYIASVGVSWTLSFAVVILLNIILVTIAYLSIRKYKNYARPLPLLNYLLKKFL